MRRKVKRWIRDNRESVFGVAIFIGLFISAYTIAITLTLLLT